MERYGLKLKLKIEMVQGFQHYGKQEKAKAFSRPLKQRNLKKKMSWKNRDVKNQPRKIIMQYCFWVFISQDIVTFDLKFRFILGKLIKIP